MRNSQYYARFAVEKEGSSDQVRWQLLKDHLSSVAELSKRNAMLAGGSSHFNQKAYFAGLLHDIGKYLSFQDRIRLLAKKAPAPAAPHAFAGALIAFEQMRDIAFAIMGHHAGMPDYVYLKDAKRNEKNQEDINNLLSNPAVTSECPWISEFRQIVQENENNPAARDLRIRMLLSCLVDADRTNSAQFEYGPEIHNPVAFDAHSLMNKLTVNMENLRSEADHPGSPLNQLRNKIYRYCVEAGKQSGNLFSLSVPTGGGKTLSSMAFALSRAVSFPEDVRRIIVVIPFLSIIEQNARVYRKIFGRDIVLEHHSGNIHDEEISGYQKKAPDESMTSNPNAASHSHAILRENWDAPIVVTTSVRFFESLFSNKPGDLRRAHNLARSVVIFDEVQTFPRGHIEPILSMIKGLADEWNSTFLFCTATQPAFETNQSTYSVDKRWSPGTITPVLSQGFTSELFQDLRRVKNPQWPSPEVKKSWDDLADQLLCDNRVLCIVNTRKHAVELFREVTKRAPKELSESGALFHLSTRMCPRHRLNVLDIIRDRLSSKSSPCIVISTQLVEAGVDIDFPVVYRAFAPFDAMIQAAGRCNREGHLKGPDGEPGGVFHVFNPEKEIFPQSYKPAVAATRNMFYQGTPSIHEPAHISYYFNSLYESSELDGENIEVLRAQLEFATVARRFEMIKDTGRGVLVPYGGQALELIDDLRTNPKPSRELLRKLQQFTVTLTESDIEKASKAGALNTLTPEGDVLFVADNYYSEQLGVILSD